MLNITNDIRQLKQTIETKAHHPYLLKYIQKPFVDENKLTLLWGLFNELDVLNEERDQYIKSTMLVQIALDTHEIVSNTFEGAEEMPEVLKNRQLQVLAGDYYSGLYYQGLASIGNIEMIRVLSSAIKNINDNKIILYQKSVRDIPTLLKTLKAIEASLVYNMAEFYKRPDWMELSGDLLLLNRLVAEKANYLRTGQSVVIDNMKNIILDKDQSEVHPSEKEEQVLMEMDKCLREVKKAVMLSSQNLTKKNEEILQRVSEILKQTKDQANSCVKEG
ncbi:heptaprenyl diphosphate synthase component 1 [Peribacillus sp. NPDC097675]|uniref:heptaprenyl diphosphate synthase component 1 n=1 Tax=Peribacillus sp. NPDC097675 TaxID=3390618 RepID=UPI003D066115